MSDLCPHGKAKSMCSRCTVDFWATIQPQWSKLFARAAAMINEQIAAGPHDWDEFKRICKRCGCTTTDWHVGSAKECGPGTHVGRAAVGAAADDFPAINRRLGEIEKETAVEVPATDNLLVKATQRYAVFDFITGRDDLRAVADALEAWTTPGCPHLWDIGDKCVQCGCSRHNWLDGIAPECEVALRKPEAILRGVCPLCGLPNPGQNPYCFCVVSGKE